MFTDILPVSSTYYVPGIILLARATAVNKTLKTLFSWALCSQGEFCYVSNTIYGLSHAQLSSLPSITYSQAYF